eukprot:TRINITY_DN58120_c0_g1_i1.p1 TRINITY_DN58120_c0_g1~~TRINITY_DN58120_c0_g1_i1.p1  ORF type:complete len:228 (-),score=24.22 TRINITY_DN58120_c0_g1_i1:64-747(-)
MKAYGAEVQARYALERLRLEGELLQREQRLIAAQKRLQDTQNSLCLQVQACATSAATEVSAALSDGIDDRDAFGLPHYRTGRRFAAPLEDGWKFVGEAVAIRISVDADITLLGVATFGDKEGSGCYQGSLELVLADVSVHQQDIGFIGGEVILLTRPVDLLAGKWLDVILRVSGPPGHWGSGGVERLMVPVSHGQNITWSFADSTHDESDTCVEGGQLPEFIFTVLS